MELKIILDAKTDILYINRCLCIHNMRVSKVLYIVSIYFHFSVIWHFGGNNELWPTQVKDNSIQIL